jgi:hypothetical protein
LKIYMATLLTVGEKPLWFIISTLTLPPGNSGGISTHYIFYEAIGAIKFAPKVKLHPIFSFVNPL